MTDKKRFCIYLLIAFGGGWALQMLAMLLGGMWYQVLVSLSMFAPMLGVLIAHSSLKKAATGIGWSVRLRGHVGPYLLAFWGPGVLSILCAVFFFLLFPSRFDGRMTGYSSQLAAVGAELPFPPVVLAIVQMVQAMTYAPLLNMFFAVGEEAGWRGFMTPYLTGHLGRTKGLLLSGVIWGVWHWPLILLAGYEYGAGYWGAPFTGMLMMCVFTTAVGILLTWIQERTESIWAPALAHGALNAAAGIGVLFLAPGTTSYILGPTMAGLVAGLPLFALAAWALLRRTPSAVPVSGIAEDENKNES
ncbi:MAG: lysostaphin resistance A-like protein [Oscillospiraceae bacterium]